MKDIIREEYNMHDLLTTYATTFKPIKRDEEMALRETLGETELLERLFQYNARAILATMKPYLRFDRDRDDVSEFSIVALTKAFHIYLRNDCTFYEYINGTLRSALFKHYVVAKKHNTHTTLLTYVGSPCEIEYGVEDTQDDLNGVMGLLLGLLDDTTNDRGFMTLIFRDGVKIKDAGEQFGLSPSQSSKLYNSNLKVILEKGMREYPEEIKILRESL